MPHTPGFPVKLVGVDELHAAFLDESRTRGRCFVPRTGNPGISLVFREMPGFPVRGTEQRLRVRLSSRKAA